MVPPASPTRPVNRHFALSLLRVLPVFALVSSQVFSQPKPVKIGFLPSDLSACAVTSPDDTLLVSVFTGPSDFSSAHGINGPDKASLTFIGRDKVTRLCFFQNQRVVPAEAKLWRKRFLTASGSPPGTLQALTPSRSINCRFDKWVTQVGDKVLPLGLLLISFQEQVPPAGTPLADPEGRIAGLILQPASANTAYAIPAEAVQRVSGDITRHRKLVRGWLGISLSTESQIPRITRVWPDSPAAKEGLRENDVIVKAGGYVTERYPDAVNALFYSIPGQATSLEILRGSERLPFQITPISQKPE